MRRGITLLTAALLTATLVGCGSDEPGPDDETTSAASPEGAQAQPQSSTSSSPASESSTPVLDSGIEMPDPAPWYADNCPAKVLSFSKSSSDDLYLAQGAVSYSPEVVESQPRVWRYNQVTMVAQPIQMADESFVFCYRHDAKEVKTKYNGETYHLQAITSPDHPEVAGFYIDLPPQRSWNWVDRIDSDRLARVLDESFTPLSDDARQNPVVIDGYKPGDGPG